MRTTWMQAALVAPIVLAAGSEANSQSAGLVDVCTGLSVNLPVLQPVAGVASGLLAGLLDPVLNSIVNNVNQNVRDELSGLPLGVTVLDQNGNAVTTGCTIRTTGIAVDAPGGIALGGGRITGLGPSTSTVAAAGHIDAIAIGHGAATGASDAALAFGTRSAVTAARGTALGADATVGAIGGVAIGSTATASRAGLGGGAEAFSGSIVASAQGAVSVGALGAERQITNVAGGTQATDAVNVRQLATVASRAAAGLGGGAAVAGNGGWTGPSFALRSGIYDNVGSALTALDDALAAPQPVNGVIAGENAASRPNAAAIGAASLAAGFGARATSAGGVALGGNALADRAGLGGGAEAFSGSLIASAQGAVSVGTLGGERQITNVAGGTQATDAVNVRQLATVASRTAAALGGGAAATGNGGWTGPGFTLRSGTYDNVGSALTALDDALAAPAPVNGVIAGENAAARPNAAATGTASLAAGFGARATSVGGVALGGNALADRAGLGGGAEAFSGSLVASAQGAVSVGTLGGERQITNVAGGTQATDAVNVRQLATVASRTAAALGGGAAATGNGGWTGPGFALRSGIYDNVGSALTAIDDTIAALPVAPVPTVIGVIAGENSATRPNAAATGRDSLASGFGARATAEGAVALGAGSVAARAGLAGAAEGFSAVTVASTHGAVSLGSAGGERQLTNLAGGTQATDAVNVRQLQAVATYTTSALGGGASAAGGFLTAPSFTLRSGIYGDVGTALAALDNAIAAIPVTPPAPASGVIAGENGRGRPNAAASGSDSLAAGYGARATSSGGVALGAGSVAEREGLAGGREAFSTAAIASTSGAVSVGAAGGERQITNLAGGTQDTDAVNLRQLRAASKAVASGLGGGAGFSADGSFTGPTYILRGSSHRDVGSAITALDQSQSVIAGNDASRAGPAVASGADSVAAGHGAVAENERTTALGHRARASAAGSTAIGAGASATRTGQVAIGTAASTYTMPGIASDASRTAQTGPTRFVTTDLNGNLAAVPVDIAAIERRIDTVAIGVDTLNERVGGVERQLRETRREARQGVASAMAMTAAPMPSRPGKTSWAGNTATFKGEWAAGFAMAHRFDLPVPVAFNAGVSLAGGGFGGARFGLSGEF